MQILRACILVPRSNKLFSRTSTYSRHARAYKSTLAPNASISTVCEDENRNAGHNPPHQQASELQRLRHIRNVGVFAHVDAGKTTVTERMLALAGVVRQAGSVDDGNTVTDYLPAERERGITIQSAAISFPWGWHNNKTNDVEANDNVTVQLIDTPGHVDFSVEVNRSVAVLDGAVLVVDSVAGVQAQTETVWRAMTRPSINNHNEQQQQQQIGQHEPLPCLALVNKMDKDGCHFGNAIRSLKQKLPGANPIPIQLPLFRSSSNCKSKASVESSSSSPLAGIEAISVDETSSGGDFVGVVDLVHMRAIVWPTAQNVADVECCIPRITNLVADNDNDMDCPVTREAWAARRELLEAMAECDEQMEEYYLAEEEPSHAELRAALRRVTLSQRAIPVMASAALRGKGVEPVLDAIADLLPSPLDRRPPMLTCLDTNSSTNSIDKQQDPSGDDHETAQHMRPGHALNPSLLALAFKVVHMKGRGGSGDGRVVFARVYSGQLKDRDIVQVISPPAPGEAPDKPRKERSEWNNCGDWYSGCYCCGSV